MHRRAQRLPFMPLSVTSRAESRQTDSAWHPSARSFDRHWVRGEQSNAAKKPISYLNIGASRGDAGSPGYFQDVSELTAARKKTVPVYYMNTSKILGMTLPSHPG